MRYINLRLLTCLLTYIALGELTNLRREFASPQQLFHRNRQHLTLKHETHTRLHALQPATTLL